MAGPTGVAARCGDQSAAAHGAAASTVLPLAGGSLSVATIGTGRHVGILLHQSDGDLCQWWPVARRWATGDVRLIVVDQCGYGQSTCTASPGAQVKALTALARRSPASSVTVVGASMGGTIALAEAQTAGADAVVDLSGPVRWFDETPAGPAAAATRIPLLVACSSTDTATEPGALTSAVAASPARPKVFSDSQQGHGVAMLTDLDGRATPLSDLVHSWIAGDRRTRV